MSILDFNRRKFLAGSAGLLCTSNALAAGKYGNPVLFRGGRAKTVIYIAVEGGLSQLDSFGIKPEHKEYSGKTDAIKSSAHGIRVGHFFPGMAKQMHHVAVVNTMNTTQGAHKEGKYYMRTSYTARSSIKHPEMGAWVSKYLGNPKSTLPNFVKISSDGMSGAGYFDGQFGALPIGDPSQGLQNSRRNKKVSQQQFEERLSLLEKFNKQSAYRESLKMAQTYLDMNQNALNLMNSKDLENFDIFKEKKSVLEAYGNHKFGQGCLMARRLTEAGTKFIEVRSPSWDHHHDIYQDFTVQAKELDQGLSALLKDLDERGLLKTTLVVLATEFGRTPEFSKDMGRGHYPKAYSCLLAGAGVRGGQLYGEVSADGKEILKNPVSVPDFNATIAHSIGLDVTKQIKSPSGRPFRVADKGQPLFKLIRS